MKTLNDISLKITEEEYHNLPYASHSKLHRFVEEGFSYIDKLKSNVHETTSSLTFGSLVDILVTEPHEFKNKVFVSDVKGVGEKLKAVIDGIYEIAKREDLIKTSLSFIMAECYSECDRLANSIGYYNNMTSSKRSDKIIADGSEYYNSLWMSEGKMIVTRETLEQARECVKALFTEPVSSTILFKDVPNVDRYFQLKFLGLLHGVKYTFMPDVVLVNHKSKTVKIYDLKTTSLPEYEFYKNYIKYGYWLQQDTYTKALREIIGQDEDLDCHGYDVVWGGFVVINRFRKHPFVCNVKIEKFFANTRFNDDYTDSLRQLDMYLSSNRVLPNGMDYLKNNDITDYTINYANNQSLN